MVSHVDDDHIQGILDLTRELRDGERRAVRPHPAASGTTASTTSSATTRGADGSVARAVRRGPLGGELPDDATVDATTEDEEVVGSTLKVLASIPQGHRLRRDAEALTICRANPEFDGKLILAAKDAGRSDATA